MRVTCASASTCCPESRRRPPRERSSRRRSTRIPTCDSGHSSSSPPAGMLRPPRRRQRSRPSSPARPTLPSGARRRLPLARAGSSPTAKTCSSRSSTTRIRTVRAAALDSVVPADAGEQEVVRRVVAALEEPRTAGSATAAVRRLGDAAIPLLAAALAHDGKSRRPPLIRAAATAATEHGLAVIEPALRDRDRVVVLAALEALDAADGIGVVPPDLLDAVFDDAAAHASRALTARVSLVRFRRVSAKSAGGRERPRTATRHRRARASPRRSSAGRRSSRGPRRRPAPRARSRGARRDHLP